MKLGWIDFSKEERNKVLSVIDLLSEDGTLDELGVAPIRDGFANIFFPGTSTIQTRAKYFLIVPYILSEIERSKETNPNKVSNLLDNTEKRCGEILTETGVDGVIGSRSIKGGVWVKRTPADIYWAGLRKYGIFTGGNLSLNEYIKVSCVIKKQKSAVKNLGNSKDNAEENECDDLDSGNIYSKSFWSIPKIPENWIDDLKIELSSDESQFLESQIISFCDGTMMAYILKNNLKNILKVNSFSDFGNGIIKLFPEDIRKDFYMAKQFSDFVYGIRIRYNVILSKNKNDEANDTWNQYVTLMKSYANIDIDAIFLRLGIYNANLKSFLNDVKKQMLSSEASSIDILDERIKKRECDLKGNSRAKLNQVGEFPTDVWIGGKQLDYRFGSAKTILGDILAVKEGK